MTIKSDVINELARMKGGIFGYSFTSFVNRTDYVETQVKRAFKDLKHVTLKKGMFQINGRKTPQLSTKGLSLPRYFWTSRDKDGKGITYRKSLLTNI